MITTQAISIDNMPYTFTRLKMTIPPLSLLSWLEEQTIFPKFYWKGQIETAVLGALATWDHLPEIEGDDDGNIRIFGGTSFTTGPQKDTLWKDFPSAFFFLPAYELVPEGAQSSLILNFLNTAASDQGIESLRFTQQGLKENLEEKTRKDLPEYPVWEKMLLKALGNAELRKVVLARRTTFTYEKRLSALSTLENVQKKSKAKVIFAFQPNETSAFIGATPERLFIRQGNTLKSDVIAGTFVDEKTQADPKLQREFSYVKEWMSAALSPLCTSLSCYSEDSITQAYKIFHIYNCFHGLLKPEIRDAQLIATLHPTPAIGGFPRETASAFIHREEPFERGWYSAPIGWTSKEAAEYAVGIRSALILENQMHLFAGLGVVEGSDPAQEWQELELKIAQFTE